MATSVLKAAEGFTRLLPSALVVVGYATAFNCLSLALRTTPVGIAYAVWAGAGIALIGWAVSLPGGAQINRRTATRWRRQPGVSSVMTTRPALGEACTIVLSSM